MARGRRTSYSEIIADIKRHRDPDAVAGMARFGIAPEGNFGVCTPTLFRIAKQVGKDHELAQRLWSSGIRDAMIVAFKIDDPKLVTEEQMDSWVRDFRSWDICDGTCLHLFADARPARKKAVEWSRSSSEFVKRAGFVMMAVLAVHDKKSEDSAFRKFFPLIKRGATDERNYVKKAVNWALRQLGKRDLVLNREAIAVAKEIQRVDSKAARWVAADALRELTSDAVQIRLRKKATRK